MSAKDKTIKDTVCEVHKFGGYALVSNCFINSTNLDWGAIGFLARVLNLPPDWKFTKAGLIAICPDGETSVNTSLALLEKWGYLKKTVLMPDQSPTGRIHTSYKFYEYSALDDSIPHYDCELETFKVDNAEIYRVKKDKNYTIVSANLLRDSELKNKLLGFILKVRSLPNTWKFSMRGLATSCKVGKTAPRSAVNKLIEMGYLVRTRLLSNESASGTFEYIYCFNDERVSKGKALEIDTETRKQALTIREKRKENKKVESVEKVESKSNPTAQFNQINPETLPMEKLTPANPEFDNPPQSIKQLYNTKNLVHNMVGKVGKSSINPAGKGKILKNDGRTDNTAQPTQAEKQHFTRLVRENVCYEYLAASFCSAQSNGTQEADEIISCIVDEICSTQPYLKVQNKLYPRAVVKSAMLKIDCDIVDSVLDKMAEIKGIRNPRKYLITCLFNETLAEKFTQACEIRSRKALLTG